MKGYNDKFLEELKLKNDIVDVISGYIHLEQKGKSFWGVCPFHHEKTPSFCINREDQFYHCFGCHKGGDVIKFVQEYESLEFTDAVKLLAERAKMPLPEMDVNVKEIQDKKQKKDRLLKLLKDAAKFYAHNLRSKEGIKHLTYVYSRGITMATANLFGLGASLSYEGLPEYLLSLNYTFEEMLEADVVIKTKSGKYIDAFVNRLIVPIINQFGEVIGFGGRVLEKTDFGKYKNTSETLTFSKSNVLYNINNVKKLKNSEGLKNIIVVEGYMDVIALVSAGFNNVVASMGTSLTKDQARMLKRLSENVIISYDGDFAGQKASVRGLEILKGEGVNVKIVTLPDEMDPDDVIKKLGAEGYKKLLEDAKPLIDYKIAYLKNSFDLKTSDGKRKYVKKALEVVKESDSAAEQEELLKQIRTDTGITYESLKRQLDDTDAGVEIKEAEETIKEPIEDKLKTAKRFIVYSILFNKPYAEGFDLKSIEFEDATHKQIIDYVIKRKENGQEIMPSNLYEELDEKDKECSKIFALNLEDKKNYNEEKYFADCVKAIKKAEIDADVKKLKALLSSTDNVSERLKIAEKLGELIKKRI